MGNGVNLDNKARHYHGDDTLKTRRDAMSLYGKGGHKGVSKLLGYALTLGTSDAWWGLVPVLTARLTEAERVSLAYMALKSLDEDTAYLTASVALFGVLNGGA